LTKLEKILKERGIKQVWLADKINKSPAELSRWLKGKRTPTYENMCKISKALNIPVEDIFFNDVVVVSAN
jgi:putative transcriptional regulator